MPNISRYFRFSLRTMFVVVTLFCLWLGWQTYEVRKRKEAIEWINTQSCSATIIGEPTFYLADARSPVFNWYVTVEDARLPWYRKLLGDHHLQEINYRLSEVSRDDIDRIQAIFPEARMLPAGDR